MAVTTTQHINKILGALKHDFPQFKFKRGGSFRWVSSELTVFYEPLSELADVWYLLHETAHAHLGHSAYNHDVELVKLEAKTWQEASVLAAKYDTIIDSNFIEDALDTYRVWLHKRSVCPQCQQTGMQQHENTYSCINCRCLWQVNEARLCNFRRKTLSSSRLTAAAN